MKFNKAWFGYPLPLGVREMHNKDNFQKLTISCNLEHSEIIFVIFSKAVFQGKTLELNLQFLSNKIKTRCGRGISFRAGQGSRA